jgi:hypothetical protein
MYTMDDYSDCLLAKSGGLYCLIDIQLVTTKPSDLKYQIQVSGLPPLVKNH